MAQKHTPPSIQDHPLIQRLRKPEDTVTTEVDHLCDALREQLSALTSALSAHTNKKEVLEVARKKVLLDAELEAMDATDLLLVYDVRLVSKDTTVIGVSGSVPLTGILEPSGISGAPEVFQTIFYSSVWQPLRVRLMKLLQESSMSARQLPALTGGLTSPDNRIPTLPAPYIGTDNLPLGE